MATQNDEARYILEILGDSPPAEMRRFLDIGAWNPKELSNTRALYERGWGGVCIEPSPGPVKDLVREYGTSADSRVQVVAAAVGVEPGIVAMRMSDDALSGNENPAWADKGGFYGWLHVPVITIQQVLNQFGTFQMVSIDTEGTSADLFRELLKTGMRPMCIVVEHDNRVVEIVTAAQEQGYTSRYISGENVVLEFTSAEKK